MAELGISIAEKLIEVIGSAVIKEICDMWGYQSQLEDLKKTVSTIKNVLLDADSKRELSIEARGYIKDLKAVVYDADDLFDEFLTLAEMNQLQQLSKGGKFFQKFRNFFSSKNKVGQAYRMSHEVKEIKNKLDGVVSNHQKFGFSIDYKPIIRRREETYSYLDVEEIIGRDADKKVVIDMLLGSEDYGIVTIVGVGGLGKTALAQLVYNDEVIMKEFPDPQLRLWVCVSDQDGEIFDVKVILCKILELVCGEKIGGNSTMELVQKKFQEELRGKKYLLILDDVWNENRLKWSELRKFLMLGEGDSRIVVTTRSEKTAEAIGDKYMHKLDGLSPENSWMFFESVAFDKEKREHEAHLGKVEIGEKIVKKCCNVPLAIKVIGNLLFGQELSKWHLFEKIGLADIGNGDNGVMSILKLSYHHLTPSLKNCFIYCAMFPKDFSMERVDLISLWIAQGYIVPLHRGQSIEDAAEEHFLILMRRCFFQDVKKDEVGDVVSVKIHDLMHDVAQEVGKEEIGVLGSSAISNLGDEVRHVYYVGGNYTQCSPCNNKVRSLISCDLQYQIGQLPINISDWMYLRVLGLTKIRIKSLPNSIGKLLHLRYINLSGNDGMDELCDSITELHNLETLILTGCRGLRAMPKDFCKLVKLRRLDLAYNNSFIIMPSSMDKLTCLKVLPRFMVGIDGDSSEEEYGGKLQDLKALINLKGRIDIKIGRNYIEDMNGMEGDYLKSMKHLTQIKIDYQRDTFGNGCLNQEIVMEKLEPHSNLKGFYLEGYEGTTISRWGRGEDNWAISLPNLVKIYISNCRNLEQIPSLRKLPFLKSLTLQGLSKLEYLEYTSSNSNSGTSSDGEGLPTFFPSLEYLEINNLKRLKRWWSAEELVEDDDDGHTLFGRLSFPHLSRLSIRGCSNLTLFPSCSTSLEQLIFLGNNKKLRVAVNRRGKEVECAGNSQGDVKLRNMTIDDVNHLKSVLSQCLTSLIIWNDENVESLSEYGDEFRRCASSLRSLTVQFCHNLRRLSGGGGGLENLTALQSLRLWSNDHIFEDEDNDDSMPWKSLNQSLHTLLFNDLKNMTSLPKGMQYLTSLQSLRLSGCKNVRALPEWISCLSSLQSLTIDNCDAIKSLPESMRNLTSLKKLEIVDCPYLEERLKKPNGEDWPKIQHIQTFTYKLQRYRKVITALMIRQRLI